MMKTIGKSIQRVDASTKADGSLRYSDDLEFEGLHADVVRSSVAYGRILSIEYDADFDFSKFTLVTHKDIKGSNKNTLLIDDQPFLAEDIVRFIGEPILLLAHKSKEALYEAKKHIFIEYEEFDALYTLQEAQARKNIIFGEDNIYKSINTSKGVAPDFSTLNTITRTYSTPHQEQLYLETQSMIARYSDNEIKIIGSMQCPFYVESALEILTGKKVEIEQAPTGGAFGGKEDYPSIMAAFVYLLSEKSQKDVKLIYNRSDDIAYTTKRHPAKMQFTSYFDDAGKLYGLEIEIALDGGAYCTLTPIVQARAVLHIAGFYDCEYIKVTSNSYATNTPPNGSFRGFGAPQAIFGIERHIDDIATELSLSPLQVREINLPTKNSKSVTNAKIEEYKRIKTLFETVREASNFDAKHRKKTLKSMTKKGIGMALFMHGAGFIGLGETFLASKVWLELHQEGQIEIKISSVEMGQGAMTALPQIVADTLNIPLEFLSYHTPNTKEVADSGPTIASRTVMIVGTLLKEAAKKIKNALEEYNDIHSYKKSVKSYLGKNRVERFEAQYQKPQHIKWDEEKFYGNGYSDYSLACYVAEVDVDLVTYQVKVTNFYAYNDVGEVINPTLAEGQVAGGIAQGIGYALYERLVYEQGRVKNLHLSDYTIPMAADMPKIEIAFLNTNASSKGLGELPMDGPAAAVANAVCHALDVKIDAIPILPEDVERLCR